MGMRIGRLELTIFPDSNTIWIEKHYNDVIKKKLELNEDDIYELEFAIQEAKRKLGLK